MPTLVLDPPPAELEELLERRRRWGADKHDEVWEGVLHMAPAPHTAHARVQADVLRLLHDRAAAAGLAVAAEFNLGGSKDDYRVPDGGLIRPGADQLWNPTAAAVVEIVSPGDETYEKLPFYAAHQVDEVLVVDPQERSVTWLGLSGGEYRPLERSRLIDLGPAELAERIDWPQVAA